jgi:ABC-type glycerol-3-phosphate transport system substrate-binding protein
LKKSLLILPLVLLASALALSACGGGGSSSSSGGGDETAIEEAIETSATSSDPSKCTEVQTEAFNEAESGASGKGALEACEEQAEANEDPAESVSVSKVEVDGDSAKAQVEVEGGSLDGQGVEIELAKEGGDWKLNKFLALTNFEGTQFAEAVEEKLAEEEGVSPALAKCVAEGLAEMSKPEAEAMIFEQSTEGVEEIAKGCE